MVHFYNTFINSFDISSLSSGGIIICSAGFFFTIFLLYELVTVSGILFPNNSPVLWTTLLEAVFNNLFLYLVIILYICYIDLLQTIKIRIL